MSIEEYGVYELIGSIVAYLSVMDVGLSTTLTRFYAKEKALGERESLSSLLGTAAVIYCVLTILAVLFGIAINECIPLILDRTFTESELTLAHGMMSLVIVNCCIVLPGNWFLAIINAEERFIFARAISIAKYVVQVAVVVVVLSRSPNALWVILVQVIVNGLCVLMYGVYVIFRLRPSVSFTGCNWRLLRDLGSFTFFVFLGMVFDQIFWKTGQVVLGATCGAAAVAIYGVSCKLITSGFMQVSTGVTSVFLPSLSALSAKSDDMTQINGLFSRIGRIQAILVWGVLSAFAAIGPRFVALWAGAEMHEAFAATLILMFGLSLSLIQNLGISILQAKNKMAFRAIVYTGLAVLDVILSVPASIHFGVIGCAATASIILFLGTGPVMNWYYWHVIGIDLKTFFREVLPLIAPPAIVFVFTASLALVVPDSWGWGGVALLAVAFCAAYSVLLWRRWLNDYEKGLVRSILGRHSS